MLDSGAAQTAVAVLALLFCFANGFVDAPNLIGTAVSARAVPLRTVVVLSALANAAGLFAGSAVALWLAGNLVEPDSVTPAMLLAAVAAAIALTGVAMLLRMPAPASHALMGALMGAAVAAGGWSSLRAGGVIFVLMAAVFSPLVAGVSGWAIMRAVDTLLRRQSPAQANPWFRRLQLLTATLVSLAHGASDGQKSLAILLLLSAATGRPAGGLPGWLLPALAAAMGAGVLAGGSRLFGQPGFKVIRLQPVQGFAVEAAAGWVLAFVTAIGIPASTTHIVAGALTGVGMARRSESVRWAISDRVRGAWYLTLPVAALLAGLLFQLFRVGVR